MSLDKKKHIEPPKSVIKVIAKQTYHFKTFIIIIRSKTTLT